MQKYRKYQTNSDVVRIFSAVLGEFMFGAWWISFVYMDIFIDLFSFFCLKWKFVICLFKTKRVCKYIHLNKIETSRKTTKKHAKINFFNLTKWYFRPKWKFNTWDDFFADSKRQKFYIENKVLIVSKIRNFSKFSKKLTGRNFLRILNILIICWLLMYYS